MITLLGCVLLGEADRAAWEAAHAEADSGEGCTAALDPLGLDLVPLPAGSFTMGSPTTEAGRDSDEHAHEVVLSRAFGIGRTELSRAWWRSLTGEEPSDDEDCGDDCPVDSVTWHEAAEFTNLLSEEAGLEPCHVCSGGRCDLDSRWGDPYACPGYRLPTEAEWEYAARAGGSSTFLNGRDLAEADVEACDEEVSGLGAVAWYCWNGESDPHPSAALEPNAWGLHDMSGNVWEWVADGFQEVLEDATDPYVAETTSEMYRGGSWGDNPRTLRVANRGRNDAAEADDQRGLRIARTQPCP